MIRKSVLAKLCPNFQQNKPVCLARRPRLMIRKQAENNILKSALDRFFTAHSPDQVSYYMLLIFQNWAVNDRKLSTNVTDHEFATFLDQLSELVNSVHRYREQTRTGRVFSTSSRF